MKTYEIRYNEAVRRNLDNAKRDRKEQYKGKSLKKAKLSLGIAQGDETLDTEVEELIK